MPAFEPLRQLIVRARRRALTLSAATVFLMLLGVGLALSLPAAFVLGNADLEGLHGLLWLQQTTLLLLLLVVLASLTLFVAFSFRTLASDAQLALRLERGLAAAAGLGSAVEFRAALEREGMDDPAADPTTPASPRIDYSLPLARAHIERVAAGLEQDAEVAVGFGGIRMGLQEPAVLLDRFVGISPFGE